MPSPERDWFADIQPIVSKTGATRATRATPAGEARKTAVSGDASLLPKAEGSRATGGNKAATVARVAQPLPNEGNTGAAKKRPQNQSFTQSVAHVALVAHEIEAETLCAWAEGLARLDRSTPKLGFTLRRWEQVVDDGGRFLDHWAGEAARLGWSAEDCFGVHPVAPGARYDCMGLVPLIGGGIVIRITTERAVIRMPDGGELTYCRRPRPGAAVLWELDDDGA